MLIQLGHWVATYYCCSPDSAWNPQTVQNKLTGQFESTVIDKILLPWNFLGLLIGTNIGPIITPWASLATLLCYERCRSAGVRVPMRTFVLTGAGLAVTGLAVSVAALLITG